MFVKHACIRAQLENLNVCSLGPLLFWGKIGLTMPRRKHLLIPLLLSVASLLFMLVFAGLTSPIDRIAFAIVFFIALLVFLVSLGHLIVLLQNGQISSKSRYRIWIVSLLILVTVMLRSAQSLNIWGLAMVVLIAFGLIFYSSRRA